MNCAFEESVINICIQSLYEVHIPIVMGGDYTRRTTGHININNLHIGVKRTLTQVWDKTWAGLSRVK